jgi:TonB family protein
MEFAIPLLLTACLSAQSDSAAKAGTSDAQAQNASSQSAPKTDASSSSVSGDAAPNSGDSTKVEPVKIQKAVYPAVAFAKKIQGQVWLKVYISEAGDVKQVEIISGDPLLAKAAIDAAKKWKFKPFIRNGKPVEISTRVPFDFAFGDQVSNLPTPVVPESNPAKRVEVTPGVSQGWLVHKVAPVYPDDARAKGVQGTVRLRAVIGTDGRIHELTPISGPKELVGAAVGAVQQWRYRPYVMNNEPTEVQTEITVIFQMMRPP